MTSTSAKNGTTSSTKPDGDARPFPSSTSKKKPAVLVHFELGDADDNGMVDVAMWAELPIVGKITRIENIPLEAFVAGAGDGFRAVLDSLRFLPGVIRGF